MSRIRTATMVVLALAMVAPEALMGQPPSSPRSRRIVMLDGREVIEGEVIVKYRSRIGRIQRERAEYQANSDGASEAIGRVGARRMRSRSMTTRQMLVALRGNPDVELVEPNYIIRANAAPNDPSFGQLWGLFNSGQVVEGFTGTAGVDINATAAWNVSTGSRANIVAVIDTGIDFTHPDLAANMFSAPRPFSVTLGSVTITCPAGSRGFDAIDNDCVPTDDNGHGTHIAGVVGAVGNNGVGITGINWNANIMALKVLGADGTGTTVDVIKAIDFAIKAKQALGADGNIRVINASWGEATYSQALADEIAAANAAEILFVASAGSDEQNNDITPHYPASLSVANVISVGAVDNTGGLAPGSNYGRSSVHLMAPGMGILSTLPNNSYGYMGGTSMSASFVSGVAALTLAHCPTLTTAQLKSAIVNTVDPRAQLSSFSITSGILNANAAVRSCTPPSLTVNGSNAPITVAPNAALTLTVANGPGNPLDWVTLVPTGAPANHWSGIYQFLNGSTTAPASGIANATLTFTAPATGGTYEFRFFQNGLYTRLATSAVVTVTGTAVSTGPSLTVNGSSGPITVTPNAALTVAVANGPANALDWVTLVPTGAPANYWSGIYQFLNGSTSAPASGVANATLTFTAPPTGGTYEFRFFQNGLYTRLATSAVVTVTGTAVSTGPSLTVNGSSGPITVTPNAALTVAVANGPANPLDWVTLVPTGAPANYWSGIYQFLNGAATAPASGMANATLTFTGPSTAGTYEFRFFQDGVYTRLATSAVVTVEPH